MRRLTFLLVLTVLGLTALTAAATSPARFVPDKATVLKTQTAAPTGRIVIKFTDASGLVVMPDGLAGGNDAVLDRVRGLLADKSGAAGLQRRFNASPADIDARRLAGQRRTGRVLPDLNRYGQIDLGPDATRYELMLALEQILADPAVETAFLEPRAVPAALGFDAFTGVYTPPTPDETPELPVDAAAKSPDYSGAQGYLGAPPSGVNALAANGTPGARGGDIKLIDIEGAWVWAHEDLPSPYYTAGGSNPDQDWRDHGTAVMGEIVGQDNGYGVRGISPEVSVGGVAAYVFSVAECIDYAAAHTDPGDVIVIELHAPGPNADGNGQFGYVPMEWWQDNYDAIEIATASGRVVCEAAGNGSQNLDDAVYWGLFNRDNRDSGAIFCGAANSSGTPFNFSNYGSRLDLNGWGGSVVTSGYGDLNGPPHPETEWYTSAFSGTSSATPMVAGSVVAVQGIVQAAGNDPVPPLQLRTFMVDSGTPQLPGHQVGSRPDILAAVAEYEVNQGSIEGTVTDADTGLPLADVTVTVVETGQQQVTGPDGTFAFAVLTGSYNVEYSTLMYHDTSLALEVVYGTPADGSVALEPLALVTIVGRVTDHNGNGLADVRVTPSTALLDPTVSDADGKVVITDVPVTTTFNLLYDGKPGFGADFLEVSPTFYESWIYPVHAQLAPATYTFIFYPWGFVVGDEWTHGVPSVGPGSGFSPTECLGIGMDGGGFPANGTFYLESPSGVNYLGADELRLSFHYWCELEDGVDGVKLQYKLPAADWFDIAPLNGYTRQSISALGGDPGWSGDSGGWQSAVFDIGAYTSEYILYRFVLSSDGANNDGFFLLDDVTLDTGHTATPVPDEETTPAARITRVAARPNPFNPVTTIDWAIGQPGRVSVKVYDTRGLRVRTLLDERTDRTSGQTIFDGQDDRGRGLASGTYLVRVSDGQGRTATTRVSLIK